MSNNKEQSIASISLLSCGLVSGFTQAALFNPWDRALYLSVRFNRPFLDKRNFMYPFSGVFQTITQRGLSAGLYFPLEEIYRDLLCEEFDFKSPGYSPMLSFMAGTLAGTTNGLLMNPLSYIKYHYWGKAECGKENVIWTAINMFRKGGLSLFFVGTNATILRDFAFGGAFALLRHDLLIPILSTHHNNNCPNDQSMSACSNSSAKHNQDYEAFIIDLTAASMATIISSPLNYVRDMHYATPVDQKTLSIVDQLRALWHESQAQPTLRGQLELLQRKLRLGWGTARVGCGMAVGSAIYNICARQFEKK